jgi:hypothetical protein
MMDPKDMVVLCKEIIVSEPSSFLQTETPS